MATQRKLKVGVVTFPYAGTSSGSSLCWDIVPWFLAVQRACDRDPRIESIHFKDVNETPVTMSRNQAVLWARRNGIDVLVMVDADMSPDCELGHDPLAKPFFSTSFDFIYNNWDKGPHVVCAPYCGPPPVSNPYVFKWQSGYEGLPDVGFKLEMYSREEAAQMAGIQECAAQPTGLIMFDVRAFELTDPKVLNTKDGWFYYEWTDAFAAHKGSTEDVTATRDMSLNAHAMLGREVLFCNWDAWAGHNKVYCVGKPRPYGAESVSARFANAVRKGYRNDEKLMDVDFLGSGHGKSLGLASARYPLGVQNHNDPRTGGSVDGGVQGTAGAGQGGEDGLRRRIDDRTGSSPVAGGCHEHHQVGERNGAPRN